MDESAKAARLKESAVTVKRRRKVFCIIRIFDVFSVKEKIYCRILAFKNAERTLGRTNFTDT